MLWVTFDTPVDEDDRADVDWVRRQLDAVAGALTPGTLVLISSQVPVGFCGRLASEWASRGVTVGYTPENLRLGRAIEVFRSPDRVIVGLSVRPTARASRRCWRRSATTSCGCRWSRRRWPSTR